MELMLLLAQTPYACQTSGCGVRQLVLSIHTQYVSVLFLLWTWPCELNVHLGLQCLSCTPERHEEFHLKGNLVTSCDLHSSSELGPEEGWGFLLQLMR